MTYLPFNFPGPEADVEDHPLWSAFREGELRLQCCADCHRFRHPPLPGCGHCGSANVAWRVPPGPALLFTYTVTYTVAHPSLKEHVPYAVVVVQYPQADDVRIVSNVIDRLPTLDDIGKALILEWQVHEGGWAVPRYRFLPQPLPAPNKPD